jgi:hypothetical protein
MEYVIQTPADRAAITELPLTAILTHRQLQGRNTGSQKWRDDNDAKRYRGHIKDLAGGIEREGQRVPIVVVADIPKDVFGKETATASKFWLIDGHHRLEAMKRLERSTIKVTVVEGQGIQDALVKSKLSNRDIYQGFSRVERIENVWSALNLPRDDYRRLPLKEAATVLNISPATIKRMRQAVREDAMRAKAIDPSMSKDKQNEQFMAYWNKPATYSHLYTWTWYRYRQGRQEKAEAPSANARL